MSKYKCDQCKDTGLYTACCRPHRCDCEAGRNWKPTPPRPHRVVVAEYIRSRAAEMKDEEGADLLRRAAFLIELGSPQ